MLLVENSWNIMKASVEMVHFEKKFAKFDSSVEVVFAYEFSFRWHFPSCDSTVVELRPILLQE